MQPRQIGILVAAVVVAFAVAFGAGKAMGGSGGGGKTAKASAEGTKPVEPVSASISATIAGAGALPALSSSVLAIWSQVEANESASALGARHAMVATPAVVGAA